MSNILIHMFVDKYSEYDIFSKTNYREMSETFRRKNLTCPNLGNRLWFQGLISEISTPENTLTYFDETMSKEYINEKFDMIVAPMANVFHVAFRDLLEHLAGRFTGIKIPVYVVACGVQADSYEALDGLKQAISEPAKAFMTSVYNTGGEFGLRGNLTKQFFEKLGFSTAVVTGCPSIYQLGRELKVSNEKVSESEFRPLLNGNSMQYLKLGSKYSNTEFFDQERFFHILHDPENSIDIQTLVRWYGAEATEWILANKVRMIPNMNDWRNYLINLGFNFSFGSRIHGSIMPILSGIPALIDARDARTKEMAEFFDIPVFDNTKFSNNPTLYEMYINTDYSDFNDKFAEKFDAYERFLVERKIVKKINASNEFFNTEMKNDVSNGNKRRLDEMYSSFMGKKLFWQIHSKLLEVKRSFT